MVQRMSKSPEIVRNVIESKGDREPSKFSLEVLKKIKIIFELNILKYHIKGEVQELCFFALRDEIVFCICFTEVDWHYIRA